MTGELRMELFGPGMTGLHKAGLAGLWMTLRSFEDDPAAMKALRSAGGSWILSETEVTLRWTGSTEQFFDALIKQSFRLYKDGLLWLPALGEPSEQTSAVLNECVLGTFLQHGKSRKSDAAANPGGKVVVPVDEDQYIITYHRIREYAHQTVRVKDARKSQQIVGWVYPGGAVRHSAYGDTAIEEPLSRFLPLLYSIVGVLYFVVRGKGRRFGNRTYAVVIPEIADLKAYADLRKHHAPKSIQDVTVSGPGEAALRLLVSVETSRLAKAVGPVACRVVTFGKVAWDKQQKKRLGVLGVPKDRIEGLRPYQQAMQAFRPAFVKPATGSPFWSYPLTPELIAENVLAGRMPWCRGFAEFVADQDIRDHVYGWERSGLVAMTNETASDGAQRAFVEACQEAWRRRLGALGERARREHIDFGGLAKRELDVTRISFSKCKNAVAMREAVTDFWAKAGSLPSLQSNWRDVLMLLNADWRLAKDLALLALASYSSRESQAA